MSKRKAKPRKDPDADVLEDSEDDFDLESMEARNVPAGPRRIILQPASEEITHAMSLLEAGDNRGALKALRAINDDDELVVQQRDQLLVRVKPDPFALGVVALGFVLIVVVAILAFTR